MNPPGHLSGLLLAVPVVALSMTACASSTHRTDVDTAFVAKADGICARAVAQHGDAKLPVADFDPLHPNAADLPAVGRYFARYGRADSTAAQLDALSPPTKHAAEWAKLRALVDQAAANARQQIKLAESSDVAGFERTVHRARSLAVQIDKLGPQVGFTSGSPCDQVFG